MLTSTVNHMKSQGNDKQSVFIFQKTSITKSAKPDGTCTLFPFFIELKGAKKEKFEVLHRCIERLYTCINMHVIFNKFIAIGIGPIDDCWAVLMRNEIGSSTKAKRSLHIYKIQCHKNLLSIVNYVAKTAKSNPDYIFNCDAYIIIKTLKLMKINWIDCEIRLLKESSSNIYRIRVGNGYRINSDDPTFVLKVNSSYERYNKEIAALERINKVYNEQKKSFYAIGHLTKDSNEIHFFQQNPFDSTNNDNTINNPLDNFKSHHNSQKKSNLVDSWFYNGELEVKPNKDNNFAGVIIMYPGNQ